MSLYSKNIESILDSYDADFELYKSYCDRLVVILQALFDTTTIPINSISGDLMSRGDLRTRLLAKGAVYNDLNDIRDLLKITVVTYFHDDINLATSIIAREFDIEEIPLNELEEAAQNHFGILMKRHSLLLPEGKYRQVEYERFAAIKTELKVRSALQHSWFRVKKVFDGIAASNNITETEINQLAQVSYLLKMADAELCRIKGSLLTKGPDPAATTMDSGDPEPLVREQPPAKRHPPPQRETTPAESEEFPPVDAVEHEKFLKEIEDFILNDRVVRASDRKIADFLNTTLVYDGDFVAAVTVIYTNMRLYSISSIKVLLDENRDVINKFMRHIYGDMSQSEHDNVKRGSSLLVLFYILIAQSGNLELIKKHIRNYSALENMSVDEFATDLLYYYRKSV